MAASEQKRRERKRQRQRDFTLERIKGFQASIERDLERAASEPYDEDDTSGRLGPWDGEPERPLYDLADNEIRQELAQLSKLIGRLLSRGSAN